MKNRYNTIDVARSISMLYIVGFWHLMGHTNTVDVMPYGEFFKNATLGLFMFLSAYLLGSKYKISNLSDYGLFLYKRFVRIMPLFFISQMSYYILGLLPLLVCVLSVLGLSSFYPPQPPTLWFVSMLISFYYIFPLLSGRSLRFQIIVSLIIIFLAYVVIYKWGYIDRRFLYYFPCFSLGVILSRFELNKFVFGWKSLLITGLLFIFFVTMFMMEYIIFDFMLHRALISITGFFMILSFAQIISVSRLVSIISYHIGYASMVAYMFHRQIWDIIEKFVYYPDDGYGRLIYLVFVLLPITIVISYAIQYCYDKLLGLIVKKN